MSGGGFTGQGNLFSDFVPTPTVAAGENLSNAKTTDLASDQFAADTTVSGQPPNSLEAFREDGLVSRKVGLNTDAGAEFVQSPDAFETYSKDYSNLATTPPEFMTPGSTSAVGGDGFLDTAKSYYDTATEYLFQGGKSDAAVNLAKEKAGQAYLKDMAAAGVPASEAGLAAAKAAAGPGILATYGPSAALAGTAAYAGGAFDTPEDPPEEELQTGADLIALDPSKYRLPEETPQYAQGPTTVGTNYGIDPRTGRPIVNPFRRPSYGLPVLAAEGGEIFPRRVGGIMPNEGTPGKDSVRAMLMPGEFVMTTDAVRGLGNGNNDQGIRNMYDMMRGLEAKGRAMA